MISSLENILITAAIFSLNLELCLGVCARAEYEINGECCPMCAKGNCVYRHCTKGSITTCVPCLESTYTAEPSGLEKCLICSVCNPGYGIRVQMKCTRSSDTVCEPMEGFYCTDQVMNSCTLAEQHRSCSPGQYIKQKGTAHQDTICDACAAGTFSDGSLLTCQTHSNCEDFGLAEIKPGTSSSDVECGKSVPVSVIAGITVSVVVVVVAAVVIGIHLKKKYKPVPHEHKEHSNL